MNKLYVVLGLVLVIVAAMLLTGGGGLGTAATAPVPLDDEYSSDELVALAQGISRGDPNAPVTVVEFGDYQCPGCGQFAQFVEPLMVDEYVETGKARFVFYDFPLVGIHPNAFLAARAARCAGDQDRYWEYHDLLFVNQPIWSAAPNPISLFSTYADQAGLDGGGFEGCLKSDDHAETVTLNMRLGEELGVASTPTVMVNGGSGVARRVNGGSYEALAQVIEEILEGAGVGN
jgi:protein-disulfide isomerase